MHYLQWSGTWHKQIEMSRTKYHSYLLSKQTLIPRVFNCSVCSTMVTLYDHLYIKNIYIYPSQLDVKIMLAYWMVCITYSNNIYRVLRYIEGEKKQFAMYCFLKTKNIYQLQITWMWLWSVLFVLKLRDYENKSKNATFIVVNNTGTCAPEWKFSER